MKQLSLHFLKSMQWVAAYEFAILVLWLIGVDSFVGIHIFAWNLSMVTLILMIAAIHFFYLIAHHSEESTPIQ